MNLGTTSVIRANSRHLPLADDSVDLVVTSPPYFNLRSYLDAGAHYAGQIGDEPTPAAFVDSLLEVTRECVRVLKPSGSLFVNLGDKYAQPGKGERNRNGLGSDDVLATDATFLRSAVGMSYDGIRGKSLIGIPWRYALRCIDDLGLILRAEVIWSKCLSGGTVVYARVKGRETAIKLHDLCRAYQPEQVELWTGERWSHVRAWEPTPRGDQQYEIELRTGERIGCTAEHRWPTWRGLVRSDELTAGDLIDTAPLPEGESSPTGLDDELVGWFVGLYIAEGSRSERTIQIAGHVKELERFKRLSDLADAYHGTCRVHATHGNAATINLTGNMLNAILDTYVGGRTAKDKHLQPKCWQRSNRFLRAVLDGYLSGDGHWREDAHRWVVGFTNNDYLASDLRTLGARLGLSVRLNRCTHTGFGQEWPGWRGSITESWRRRKPDNEIVAIRPSRARQFWDVSIEDEPHLFALASGVLTHNSNGLPESVTDRVRRSHEVWFHFTLSPQYFSAVDEIRESYGGDGRKRGRSPHTTAGHPNSGGHDGLNINGNENPLGKLPGSVWEVPTEPLRVPDHLGIDHFAAFPTAFPKRIIQGWSPAGVCVACGEGRRPVTRTADLVAKGFGGRQEAERGWNSGDPAKRALGVAAADRERTITGYACDCPPPTIPVEVTEFDYETEAMVTRTVERPDPTWVNPAPTTPAVVLDPFGGTGTTAMVAKALGRHGITVDMSADYCRLAEWRTNDRDQLAKVLGIAKVEAPHPAEQSLFDMDMQPAKTKTEKPPLARTCPQMWVS